MTDRPAAKAERILDAAQQLLAERGHAAVTVAEISREAGISRGLLHYYFDSKEHILAQVVRRNVEITMEDTRRLLASANTRQELLEQIIEVYQQALGRSSFGYALYYEAFVQGRVHDSVRHELAELFQARRGSLAEALVAAEERGSIDLPHDPAVVASLILAIGDGVALQYLADPEMPITEAGRVILPVLLDLLGGT